jgi:hypothetical protein
MSATALFEFDIEVGPQIVFDELKGIWKKEIAGRFVILYDTSNTFMLDSETPSARTLEISDRLIAIANQSLQQVISEVETDVKNSAHMEANDSRQLVKKPRKRFVCEVGYYEGKEDSAALLKAMLYILQNSIGNIYYFREPTFYGDYYLSGTQNDEDRKISTRNFPEFPPDIRDGHRYEIQKDA